MLATLILGILAGIAAPRVEPQVKGALDSVLLSEVPLSETELRLFSFALCLLAAALLAMIFGKPHALALALGGALGVFGPRLMAKYKASKAPDYDS